MRLAGALVETLGTKVSNTWLLTDQTGRRFLIDTGHRLERRALRKSLASRGVRGPGDLEAVLLTHRHSDHAGNAAWARARFATRVVCHEQERELLAGGGQATALGGRGAFAVHDALARVEDNFPARSPVDECWAERGWRFGFDVIHVGGHTAGSVLLHHRPSGALFTGDALLTGLPMQPLVRLRLAYEEYSLDAAACHRGVLSFLGERPDVRALFSGHGPAVRRRLAARLNRLAARAR
jgi:glyoxylase-like metal-dependent hydrolase (beta-lactamase superfamily II)